MGQRRITIAGLAVATALMSGVVPVPASAQTLNDALTGRAQAAQGKERLLVEAKEIVYNNDTNTVSAVGDVELNYGGRTLQADRVTYDRNTGRVFAEGNARLTDANGTVVTGDRFELTEDFKNGFIQSLRVQQTTVERGQPITARFSAPRAERIEGETTVFERGTYTACEPCREHPERPPFWQVKAARIVHNNSERTIYYEDATLELAGVPIAYVPYFSTPDPTVKRKTGFLPPRYVSASSLGTGVSVPFFWALAPNYDLTLTPTVLSQQGVLGQAEWRHRLLTGAYNIRVAGIFQQDKEAFLPSPFGAGDREWRGSLESAGQFNINERWRFGWDVALLSDKYFLTNYRIRSESLGTLYLRESISTAYLQGQGERSWFDVRGYYFKGLSSSDFQKQQPVVHPVWDYNRRFDGPAAVGGEVGLDVNLTSLTREAAAFEATRTAFKDYLFPGTRYYGLYETCTVFERGTCLVRGLSGTFTRLSAQATWRRTLVDDAGQVWTPFAYVRTDGFWNLPSTTGYQNAAIQNFGVGDPEINARVMPAVGIDYRYPFVANAGAWGTHIIEPIAQVIARPGETRVGKLPNEDAQSLIFDDTNLFQWDKFSGYDRVEGGMRANLGAQYTITTPGGFYGNALFGQSYHLAGRNSFDTNDLVHVGRDTGLDKRLSDYVGRLQVSPSQNLTFITRARWDEATWATQRFEAQATANLNPWLPLSASVTYARYAPQPELGFDKRREGVIGSATYFVTPRWFLSGSALFDFDQNADYNERYKLYLANPALPQPLRKNEWSPISTTLGAGYNDECTTFSVNYTYGARVDSFASGEKDRVQTLLVRLELKTLGAVNVSQNFGLVAAAEGAAAR